MLTRFLILHLFILQAQCIFEGCIFKFEYMQAQVSIGTRAQLLILHLYILQALCIFEDYFFKFEHIISGLIVSIGTRAQQVQVVICTKAQWVIRAQVTSCKRLSEL